MDDMDSLYGRWDRLFRGSTGRGHDGGRVVEHDDGHDGGRVVEHYDGHDGGRVVEHYDVSMAPVGLAVGRDDGSQALERAGRLR
jgi:hypothetical protein